MSSKIQPYHKEKLAYVYLRQSSIGQVRNNRESTERQYALKDRAELMGWRQHQITVLDNDLGVSGASTDGRKDFKILVADVSMGKVGAVFALEASRLSRSCTDWHRLLEICALTNTLIIDGDGCYNPSDFNDQLLLGLKGSMSQAELHFIKARMNGGKINKAKKGELRFQLPAGYCYDDASRIVMDHDEQVRAAIYLFFKVFKEQGSAFSTSWYFIENNLQFPKRAYGNNWKGKISWGKLTLSRAAAVLNNPSYAGVYGYSRNHREKSLLPDGTIRVKTHKLPQSEWQVAIQDHHEGYITWDEYLENQKCLKKNQCNGIDTLLPGPVREGLALLHGLLLCAYCGRRVTVRYQGNAGIKPYYQCNNQNTDLERGYCFHVRCEPIDLNVTQRILSIIEPKQIQIAVAALEELENRQKGMSKQWQLKLQRAEYEVNLAQRRYEEVDPSNRLVAATLENRWNEALSMLDEAKKQYDAHNNSNHLGELLSQKDELLKLTQDFPRIWNAESTSVKDRKRIVRLLIKDITVKVLDDRKNATLYIRWQGGATEEMTIVLPNLTEIWRYSSEIIEEVRRLALSMPDKEIVRHFHEKGLKTNKGNQYTRGIIGTMRQKNNIPSFGKMRKPGELSINELAQKLDVGRDTVCYWIKNGTINTHRYDSFKIWILLTPEEENALREKIKNSVKIQLGKKKSLKE